MKTNRLWTFLFSFGKILSDENFTDRQEDIARLTANFNALINTVLISPRRWGKSSLVRKALEKLPKDEFIVIEFDAFKSKDWPSFLQNYAVAINKSARTDNSLSRFIASHIPSVKPRLFLSAGNVSMGIEMEINLKKAPETDRQVQKKCPDEQFQNGRREALRRFKNTSGAFLVQLFCIEKALSDCKIII